MPGATDLAIICNKYLMKPLRVQPVETGTGGLGSASGSKSLGLLSYLRDIAVHQCIPTRDHNLHDFLNLLTWLAFPRLKLEIVDHSLRAFRDFTGPGRPAAVDRLTIFDEAGLIYVTEQASLPGVLALAQTKRDQEKRHLWDCGRVIGLGHGLLEHLLTKNSTVFAMTLFVNDAEYRQLLQVGRVEGWQELLPPSRLGSLPIQSTSMLLPAWLA